MPLDAKTVLQVLVLTLGMYVVLGFLRTTRGSGLVRGLVVAIFVVVGGTMVLTRQLALEELQYIVDAVVGFLVVILAIVFQPELRRGIVQLGENSLLRRFLPSRERGVVEEVSTAVVTMARKKQGALIAFERDTPLDPYVGKHGVRIDAVLTRHLLDGIFHHGGALHDGAVIVRGDRVEAAMAILPLSESEELGKSLGTRHRAALGLTEETDAVTVVVSEETGYISLCKRGRIERRIPRGDFEKVLTERLGGEGEDAREAWSFRRWARGLVLENLGQKALAAVLGIGLFALAFRSIRTNETYTLEVVAESGTFARRVPSPGVLRLVLPEEGAHLADPRPGASVRVEVSASRSQLARLAGGIGGVVEVPREWVGLDRDLAADEVDWGTDTLVESSGLEVAWVDEQPPRVSIERVVDEAVAPDESAVRFEPEVLASGYEVDRSSIEFDPPSVVVRGPAEAVRALLDGGGLAFEPVDLSSERGGGFVRPLKLARTLTADRIVLAHPAWVRGRLRPVAVSLGEVELEVTLQCFDPERRELLDRYEAPQEKVQLRVVTYGLLPPGLDAAAERRARQSLVEFVRDEARVFIDVARGGADSNGSAFEVEIGDLDDRWRDELGPTFDAVRDDPDATIRLEFVDPADRRKILVRRSEPDDDDGETEEEAPEE